MGVELSPTPPEPESFNLDTHKRIKILSQMAVAGLPSENTRRVYSSAIRKYLESGALLTREDVLMYLDHMRDTGAGAVTLNVHLAAIKRLVEEARIRGGISANEAQSIDLIKQQPVRGIRVGNWLTIDGLRELIKSPDRSTRTGKRDAAIFALLAGCGLRRTEASEVLWAHYQEREERMCLVDLKGKGRRYRTVPVPEWARGILDEWRKECECECGGTIHRSVGEEKREDRHRNIETGERMGIVNELMPSLRDVQGGDRELNSTDNAGVHPAPGEVEVLNERGDWSVFQGVAESVEEGEGGTIIDEHRGVIAACEQDSGGSGTGGKHTTNRKTYSVLPSKGSDEHNNHADSRSEERILGGLTESGVWYVVKQYSDKLGIDIRPHDLRRTIAKLMQKNGADVLQIQMFLGHSDPKTTVKYLGNYQELGKGKAGIDKVDINE